jgi:transcriptional regulator with GAF, ATPase, and Fis domain
VTASSQPPSPGGVVAIAESPSMLQLFKVVQRVGPAPVPVLVTGETGVGKEVIARLIHEASGRRKGFVPVNCAALPLTLAESELFGHMRGAFTGAVEARRGLLVEADGGTLFVDEIGDMPPAIQSKLLRVLEDGQVRPVGATTPVSVDVRVVGATNRNLVEEVRAGRFREDLYHRLVGVPLWVPPLRERPEDIPPLVEKFLTEATRGRKRPELADGLMMWLQLQPWPGNVRELRQAVHRATVIGGEVLVPADFQVLADLPTGPQPRADEAALAHVLAPASPLLSANWFDGKTLKDVEREAISRALARHGGRLRQTARSLGIAHTTLLDRARSFGLIPKAKPRQPPQPK